jgi:hypothetical protein
MRTLLFALLVFLPLSSAKATPPPQGWEERNELRSALPQVQKDLDDYRKKLNKRRIQVADYEAANRESKFRAELSVGERNLRLGLYALERRLREMEEEVARIKRRLGIKP